MTTGPNAPAPPPPGPGGPTGPGRLVSLLAALVLALGAVLFAASPAQAAYSDCPDQYFCFWTGTNATGARFQYSRSNFTDPNSSTHPVNNGIRLTSGATNRGYSWYNRLGSSWSVHIYDAVNCSTASWYRTLVNGQSATAQGSDWGGRVSSIGLASASPLTC